LQRRFKKMQVLVQVKLKGSDVKLEHVWRRLGYPGEAQTNAAIQRAFQQAVECGKTLLEPAACYDIFPLEAITPSSIRLNGVSFESRELAARCHDAEELAIFIVTIGPRLEERVNQLLTGEEPLTGYILDNFGSEATKSVFYRVKDIINDYARSQGLRLNGWFCPGWRDLDWELCEQRKLLSLVKGSQIGVHLKESCMMTPRKSYAGVLPLGTDPEGAEDERGGSDQDLYPYYSSPRG